MTNKDNSLYIDVDPIINIGFDLHGVLDNYANDMIPLLKQLTNNRHVIHILSGPPKRQVEQELSKLGYIPEIHYHYLFSIVDYLKSENVKMWKDTNDTWWTYNETWWKSKGNYCKTVHCEYLFDNSLQYKKYMPSMTNFVYIKDKQSVLSMIELLHNIKE